MLSNYRIIRDAAERVGVAAEGTLLSLRDGRVEQEPAFTDRMLGRIEFAMEGYAHNGVSWRAKTLTDRGRGAQEARFGADFFGVLDINLPGYIVRKGFLAQAKLIEPGGSMGAQAFEVLQEQCRKMLRLSADAFVFLYSRQGISCVPALAVASSERINPHNLYSRSITRFYEEHFACFFGDPIIGGTQVTTLEALAAAYDARTAIQLVAEAEELSGRERKDHLPVALEFPQREPLMAVEPRVQNPASPADALRR
jgi:hypothetical protein